MRLLLRLSCSHDFVDAPDIALVELDEDFWKRLDARIQRALGLQRDEDREVGIIVGYAEVITAGTEADIDEFLEEQQQEPLDWDPLDDRGYMIVEDHVKLPEYENYFGTLYISLSPGRPPEEAETYWEFRDKYRDEVTLTTPPLTYGQLRKLAQEKSPAR